MGDTNAKLLRGILDFLREERNVRKGKVFVIFLYQLCEEM